MTIPTCTITRSPTSVNCTTADPAPAVTLTDTTSYSPAANAKQWKLATVAIPGANGLGTTQVVRCGRAGTPSFTLTGANTDGNNTSSAVTVTVTDAVATAAAAASVGGVIPPASLPAEYLDPTIATPGQPAGLDLYCARVYGTIAPGAGVAAIAG